MGSGMSTDHRVVCALQLWAGSMDGKIYVYDADADGALSSQRAVTHESLRSGVRSLAHNGAVEGGSWTTKPTIVVAGAEDGHVAIWDVDKESHVASAAVHSNIVSAVCAMGDLVRRSHFAPHNVLVTDNLSQGHQSRA